MSNKSISKPVPSSAHLQKYKTLSELQHYYLPILELQSLNHPTAAMHQRELQQLHYNHN